MSFRVVPASKILQPIKEEVKSAFFYDEEKEELYTNGFENLITEEKTDNFPKAVSAVGMSIRITSSSIIDHM